jgi:hypothetical protein
LTPPRLPGLPERTRADLASAVRCFCRVTGLDPQVTDAGDLAALQAHLATANPERFGITPARWGVVRSQMIRALVVSGAAQSLQTATTRLSPGWEDLIAGVSRILHRHALSRFARFCIQRGLEPAAVTQQTFDGYREALSSGSLVRNPTSVYREAVLAWSQMPEVLMGCSASEITVPPNRHGQTAWPPAPV